MAILCEYKVADPWKDELVFPDDEGQMYKPASNMPERILRV